jgi:hypothetical protein
LALVCRPPAFWGRHGGLANAVLEAGGGCLAVCGTIVTNVDVSSASSALEALCVPPFGSPAGALARQLTALALNCVASGLGPDCAGDPDRGELFASCNALCQGKSSKSGVRTCVRALRCLNAGGAPGDKGRCTYDDKADCKYAELPPEFDASDDYTGDACREAAKNGCAVVGYGAKKCDEAAPEGCEPD